MSSKLTHISKFLSLVLRHQPETIGLQLDENGWAHVQELIQKVNENGPRLTMKILKQVVAENDKQRFAFNDDGMMIRASQGHSIAVELNLKPVIPPEILYHGTIEKCLPAIRAEGLRKMNRRHVHLSAGTTTAVKVGGRRGKPVILAVQAGRMAAAGYLFYISENGVWLTDEVPAEYIVTA